MPRCSCRRRRLSSASSGGYDKDMIRAYEEIVDSIAAGMSSDEVARFEASQATKAKVEGLIAKEKGAGLEPDEASELAHYLHLEHVMRLAKARAQGHRNDQLRQR